MNFEISEKLAVVHLIDVLIYADGIVHDGEINSFCKLMELMDFDANFLIQARNLSTEQSIAIVKSFSRPKKERLEELMQEMAKSDGFVHPNEVEIMHNALSTLRSKYI